jgi:purine-binding chemotaxis protein CheW
MTERAPQPDPSIIDVLEGRARLLARPPEEEPPGEAIDLVILGVGEDRYAVEGGRVREVLAFPDLTPVPGTPAAWSGLVNVRGALYPVIDLHTLSGCAPRPPAAEVRVVLVDAAGNTVGLAVDTVPEIRRVRVQDIDPPVVELPSGEGVPVTGVTPDLVAVLDLDALLKDPRIAVGDGRAPDPRERG